VCLQLLSVAYAKHELTGDTVDVSLAWLEAGGRSSVEQLQEAAGA
jgi:membrane protein required for beta-lactamase induction